MDGTRPDLAAFLLQRISEDEKTAQQRRDDGGDYNSRFFDEPWQLLDDLHNVWLSVDFRRVLAECESKRQIVELHRDNGLGWCDDDTRPTPCTTLRRLAAPYSDHPDFVPDWRL